MKTLLLSLLIALPFLAKAQYPEALKEQWAAEDKARQDNADQAQHAYDSMMFAKEKHGELTSISNLEKKQQENEADFIDQYGSHAEFEFQKNQMYNSFHGCLVSFIGAKAAYLGMISEYLSESGYGHSTELDAKDAGKNAAYVIMTTKKGMCIGCKQLPKITVKALVNANTERVKSVTITGDIEELIHLFIFYWPTATIRADKLIKGRVIYQDHGSDRITFNWASGTPYISITQNPNIGNFFASLKTK